ncbi:DUF6290 family protein [uncultured Mobiluncus sp.]|uniref:type II toxin-antitoxin system RelB family antitoxin n=1 Tax=uncultured Mobiluncus sp. TaxID=293425 RepID=UPI0025E17A87|nr:DUF6290 family protein [uncultured Mobiluncus sp.]
MSEVLSLRLPQETKQRLDALSEQTRRPASFYIRQALEEYLDDLEDYYLAVDLVDKVESGDLGLVSAEQVKRELGF